MPIRKKAFAPRGFTLLEVIITVVIIGILMGIAVPTYLRTIESTKGAKVVENLGNIRSAEGIARIATDSYTTSLGVLRTYQGFSTNDGDWTYAVTAASANTFLAVATRASGPYQNYTARIDESGGVDYYNATGGGPFSKYPP